MARDADRGPFFAEAEKLRVEAERVAEREAVRQLSRVRPASVCPVCGEARCWGGGGMHRAPAPAAPEPEPATDDGGDDDPLIVAA